ISQTLGVRKSQFEVENPINSNVGDQVVIGIEEKNLIKSSIAVYLVPILCLLMAAWSGEQLFRIFGVGSSDVVTIVTGLAGFITGLLWLKHYNFKISQNSEFYPVILRKQTGMHTGSEE
ncbi:MAG: SoxR reducing system RseC family protein, partial [Gammaproteobacteria bacterium]